MPCLTSYFKTQREYNDRSRHRSKSRSYIETDTESQIGIDTIILALGGYKQPSSGQTQTHCHETDRNIPACDTHTHKHPVFGQTQTLCLWTDTYILFWVRYKHILISISISISISILALDRQMHPPQFGTDTHTPYLGTNTNVLAWDRHKHPHCDRHNHTCFEQTEQTHTS